MALNTGHEAFVFCPVLRARTNEYDSGTP